MVDLRCAFVIFGQRCALEVGHLGDHRPPCGVHRVDNVTFWCNRPSGHVDACALESRAAGPADTARTSADGDPEGYGDPRCHERHQPSPQPNSHPAAWDLVISDMRLRDQIGEQRYGTRLQPFNGRNALQDLYEELLDAAVYARQRLWEEDAASAEPAHGYDRCVEELKFEVGRLTRDLGRANRQLHGLDAELSEAANVVGHGTVLEKVRALRRSREALVRALDEVDQQLARYREPNYPGTRADRLARLLYLLDRGRDFEQSVCVALELDLRRAEDVFHALDRLKQRSRNLDQLLREARRWHSPGCTRLDGPLLPKLTAACCPRNDQALTLLRALDKIERDDRGDVASAPDTDEVPGRSDRS